MSQVSKQAEGRPNTCLHKLNVCRICVHVSLEIHRNVAHILNKAYVIYIAISLTKIMTLYMYKHKHLDNSCNTKKSGYNKNDFNAKLLKILDTKVLYR